MMGLSYTYDWRLRINTRRAWWLSINLRYNLRPIIHADCIVYAWLALCIYAVSVCSFSHTMHWAFWAVASCCCWHLFVVLSFRLAFRFMFLLLFGLLSAGFHSLWLFSCPFSLQPLWLPNKHNSSITLVLHAVCFTRMICYYWCFLDLHGLCRSCWWSCVLFATPHAFLIWPMPS